MLAVVGPRISSQSEKLLGRIKKIKIMGWWKIKYRNEPRTEIQKERNYSWNGPMAFSLDKYHRNITIIDESFGFL